MLKMIKNYLIKEELQALKDMKKLQSIMLSDEYMVGLYNGIECSIAYLEQREPIYHNSSFRNSLSNNPNIKNKKVTMIDLSEVD